MNSADLKPSIFNFLDLVQFLQTHFKWRKNTEAQFSYSAWSNELGIGSKTILRFILQRKRRVSLKTAQVLKSNIRLTDQEAEYFDYLLSYSQPRSEAERIASGTKLINLQRASYKQVEFDAIQTTIDVLGPVVLTLLTFKDFVANDQNLADFLKVDKKRIQELMSQFIKSGLVKNNDDVYFLPTDSFKIADNPQLDSLKKFHAYWLEKGKEALQLDFQTRRFRSLKFALSEDEFHFAVERINDFAVSILSQFQNMNLSSRRLYMMENVLFPITDKFHDRDEINT
jgi:uncharacterized protein (TIGR02147 family)